LKFKLRRYSKSGGQKRGAVAPPTTTFADVAGVDEVKVGPEKGR